MSHSPHGPAGRLYGLRFDVSRRSMRCLATGPCSPLAKFSTVEATREVSEFLDAVTLEDCFCPETWPRLPAFVKVRPQDDTFPVRVKYDPHGPSWQIGSNPLTSDDGVWFALPDVVAAKLLYRQDPGGSRSLPPRSHGHARGHAADQAARRCAGRPAHTGFLSRGHRRAQAHAAQQALDATERDRLAQGAQGHGQRGQLRHLRRDEPQGTAGQSQGAGHRLEQRRTAVYNEGRRARRTRPVLLPAAGRPDYLSRAAHAGAA